MRDAAGQGRAPEKPAPDAISMSGLGHDRCSVDGVDPNGPPVPLHCGAAGCPPDAGTFTGAGWGSFGIPRWTVLRYALTLIPYIGASLAGLLLPTPTNLAAMTATQEDMERATTTAFGALLALNGKQGPLQAAFVALLQAAVGDARNPGYVTTCAQLVAQDLNQQLTLIVINALFLVGMLVAIVWALA